MDIPPAAFVFSLVLLAVGAAQDDFDGLGWITAGLLVDLIAVPLALPAWRS